MGEFRATNVLDEATELVAQSSQDLVFVLDRFFRMALVRDESGATKGEGTVKEGNELISGSLRAQGKSDGGEAADGVQSEQDIVVLQKTRQRREERQRWLSDEP